MFINEAFAQATDAAAATGSMASPLIQLGLVFVIFYIFLIRPQQKKIKQHEAMVTALKKGDKIVTGGGIYAKVVKADDPIDLTVEIADGVIVEINRGTVREVLSPEILAAAQEAKAKIREKAANSNKKNKK